MGNAEYASLIPFSTLQVAQQAGEVGGMHQISAISPHHRPPACHDPARPAPLRCAPMVPTKPKAHRIYDLIARVLACCSQLRLTDDIHHGTALVRRQAMRPLLRVPYTDPLPPPKIIPASATTAAGAIAALVDFLSSPAAVSSNSVSSSTSTSRSHQGTTLHHDAAADTVLLTGAGISVASGLADYRGTNGTYTLNKSYRPIYFSEFCENHEARKRYWARSFLGWTNLQKARPNAAHRAVGRLGELGVIRSVVTQSDYADASRSLGWRQDRTGIDQATDVDSFHTTAHPSLPTIELHGYLRSLVCLTCHSEYPRDAFQTQLASLNPAWAAFLEEIIATGALDTENLEERRKKGLKANPDGDVDIPNAPYTTFRYPACPVCLSNPPRRPDGSIVDIRVDKDGSWEPSSSGGILKPAVIMFGESIPGATKNAAELAVNQASKMLIVGSSLATYSAWRLVKHAKEQGKPIGILNIGGCRGEDTFFADVPETNTGRSAVRCSENADKILPQVVKILEGNRRQGRACLC
ncbi:DHS-like NAD/FAD-binding domain-containing protein [Lojkania enalia]|uniref:DHS-like NAD/FAD-binding domain-containing protein n=1 Tax=Lojkania enalia TaxID=147567 RepID=A0A9P4NCX2_9PLEO|nr:DHS-like NAD/FAD-binding domain-containing protein [Didymosphaeria enalia]